MNYKNVRMWHLLLFHCSDRRKRSSLSAWCSKGRAPNSIRSHHYWNVTGLWPTASKTTEAEHMGSLLIILGRQMVSNLFSIAQQRSQEMFILEISASSVTTVMPGFLNGTGNWCAGNWGLWLWSVFYQALQKNVWHRKCTLLYSVLVCIVYLSKTQ